MSGGVWICCICHFGWQKDGSNRYQYCSAGGCIHEVCPDCKAWNSENVALMRAAHESEGNSDEETQSQESSESENEPTEGELDEYSYEGEAEEELDSGLSCEEGDESVDYSLYQPPSDDESD